MNKPKTKGTAWETAIVDYLRIRGVAQAERRAPNGATDRGDVAGIPGVVIEAKNAQRYELGSWVSEAEVERINAGASYGVVWAKRRGKTSPGDGYVVLTGEAFVRLLAEAGYVPPESPS